MAYTNNQYLKQRHDGIDMTTMATVSHAHGSLANGVAVCAVAEGALTATGSPAAVLGTGANADRSTPAIEAV